MHFIKAIHTRLKAKGLEGNEHKLKQQLSEKEQVLEETKLDLRKKINIERRKYEQQNDEFKKYKEETQKKHALIVKEVKALQANDLTNLLKRI